MSDLCYCEDGDRPSVFESQDVMSARAAHPCDECLHTILPGESYRRVWGVWDGEAKTYRACCRCMVLEEWVVAHFPCYCPLLGGLIERVSEEIDNNREAAVLRPEFDALMADIHARTKSPPAQSGGKQVS